MQTVNKREVQHNQELHNKYDYKYPYNRPRKRHERDGATDLDAALRCQSQEVGWQVGLGKSQQCVCHALQVTTQACTATLPELQSMCLQITLHGTAKRRLKPPLSRQTTSLGFSLR